MADILFGLQEVEERLENLIGLTEDYYQLVYENLPSIEKNIDFTEEETHLLINYFIETKAKEKEGEEQYLISKALTTIQNNFNKIRRYLLSKEEIDEILEHFLGGKSRESSFDTFLEKIKEIEGTLQDVTDISFNAIIFSAHLGEKGQGFRVISDHINETSDYLEQLFLSIDVLIQGLIEWHHKLQKSIEEIAVGQERAVEEYIGNSSALFSSLTNTFQEVSQILRNMVTNAKEALSPFQELMALIQRQDILRQKMENTIKSIRLVKEKYQHYLSLQKKGGSKEVILNHTAFLHKSIGMLHALTQMMTESLTQSLSDITKTLYQLLLSLKEIRDDAEHLAIYMVEEKNIEYQEKRMSMVDYTFVEIFSFMEKFIQILKEISTQVLHITSNTEEFTRHINKMEKDLQDVQRRVDRLNKIKLLARIELARMDQKGSNFGAEIDDIVKDINQTVADNRKAYSVLKKDLENDLNNFDHIIVENQKHIDKAVDDVSLSLRQLTTTNSIINQAVVALNQEMHLLYGQIEKVYGELKKTSDMEIKSQEILNLLLELRGDIEKERKVVFQQYQVKEWEEEDRELLQIYELFTSYLERFSAKEYLQDAELDEGAQEGELTIF